MASRIALCGGPIWGSETRPAHGTDALETQQSDEMAGDSEGPERGTPPQGDGTSVPLHGAREAGIDAAILNRLLSPMEPEDRSAIRSLCAQDLERTRSGARQAVREWDPETLARHLHVMSSLAQTIGADELADEARRLQVRLRSGATSGYEAGERRMSELARRAASYLAEEPNE